MSFEDAIGLAFSCDWLMVSCCFFCTADPKGIELVLPSCYEDKEVIPLKSYYGGIEGTGKYIWYRTKEKIDKSELVNKAAISDGALVVGEAL